MSVVSSTFSNVSSLLKNTEIKSEIIRQNNSILQNSQLPEDIDDILSDFKNANKIKEYRKLICLLHEGNIKDSNLAGFILNTRSYICHLNIEHELFIEALLQIHWIEKSPEVIYNYKLFLQDLISIQTCHTKTVMYHLIELFKPNKILTSEKHNDAKYEVDEFKVDLEKLNHVHDTLRIILKAVPMSDVYLMQAIESKFPYMLQDSYVHQIYIHMLLKMIEYTTPNRRLDILSLIIQKLMTLDITIPQKNVYNEKENEEEDQEENEEEDDTIEMANGDDTSTVNDDTDKTNAVNPIMHTLDVCMEVFFKYMREFCFANDRLQIESLRILYIDILRIFETIILPTQATRCVQYIMFYICSFKPIVAEMFVDWLWRKMNNPNLSIILRKSVIYYISSLCANASFITSELVELTMAKLIDWIHDYITRHEYAEYLDKNAHVIFYAVCRAFFHLFIMRHKEFISSINGILFLQELDIPRIINCKLNPLQMCESQIVQNFAEITNAYQLAYCYTVVENNQRSQLSILEKGHHEFVSLIDVFPFEFYALQDSGQKIISLVRYNDTNRYQLINRHY